MLALKAIERDIAYHRALAGDASSDGDAAAHAAYVLDLMSALSEIGDFYEHSRGAVAETPPIDQLLDGSSCR